jgi:hypothetical protein
MAVLLAGIALAGGVTVHLAAAQPNQTTQPKNNIWKDEVRETQPPWWQRELSNEVIDKVLKGMQTRDPAKAKQLIDLRKKDPERFKAEIRQQGLPELEQISRDRYEGRRLERTAKFLEWLKATYPQEEQALAKLKNGDPQLYARNLDRLTNQYGYIFDTDSSNPELGRVLKEDLELKRKAEDLCRQIRNEKLDAKKQTLGTELQDVISKRYDLIVRRKEIAYEQLLKKLEELEKNVRASKDEMEIWRDVRIKQENVKQRTQELIGTKVRFKWD